MMSRLSVVHSKPFAVAFYGEQKTFNWLIQLLNRLPISWEKVKIGADVDYYAGYFICASKMLTDSEIAYWCCLCTQANNRGLPIFSFGEAALFLFQSGVIPGVESDRAVIQPIYNDTHISSDKMRLVRAHDYHFNWFTQEIHAEETDFLICQSPRWQLRLTPALKKEMDLLGLCIYHFHNEEKVVQPAVVVNKRGNAIAILPGAEVESLLEKFALSMLGSYQSLPCPEVFPLRYWYRS
jgi:hypothetical protein